MSSAGPRDAIVVGAGIVGAACALALAEAGLDVLVLEAGFPGGGTTAAGMGHLVVMDDSPAQIALCRRSCELWRSLLPSLGADVEDDPCGTLWVAADDEEMGHVQTKVEVYRRAGVEAEILDAAAVAEAEPELRPGLAGALRVPGDRVIYPPAANRRLIERAQAAGAELRCGVRVDGLEANGVRCAENRIPAGAVVLATGAEAATLVPELPIEPRKGHLAITDRYPGFCRHQLVELGYLKSAHSMHAESVAFNVQPRATGQLLIGSSRQLVGFQPEVEPRLVDAMLRRAFSYLPRLAELRVLRTWTGFRPATLDSLPLIGRWPAVDGLWIAAGHEGLGIATALATGELLGAMITGAEPEIDPTPYAPIRVLRPETAG